MKGPIEVRADILKTFIQEDRKEIRALRDRIHSITSSVLVASFAITAFLFGKNGGRIAEAASKYSGLVDILLVCLIIASFVMLKVQLVAVRKSLNMRQDLLIQLPLDAEATDLNPFQDATHTHPDIHDRDQYVLAGLGVLILIIKAIIVACVFGLE